MHDDHAGFLRDACQPIRGRTGNGSARSNRLRSTFWQKPARETTPVADTICAHPRAARGCAVRRDPCSRLAEDRTSSSNEGDREGIGSMHRDSCQFGTAINVLIIAGRDKIDGKPRSPPVPTPDDMARQYCSTSKPARRLASNGRRSRRDAPAAWLVRCRVEEEPPRRAPLEPDRCVALAVLVEEVKSCTACGELASDARKLSRSARWTRKFASSANAGSDEDRKGEPLRRGRRQLLNKIIGRLRHEAARRLHLQHPALPPAGQPRAEAEEGQLAACSWSTHAGID